MIVTPPYYFNTTWVSLHNVGVPYTLTWFVIDHRIGFDLIDAKIPLQARVSEQVPEQAGWEEQACGQCFTIPWWRDRRPAQLESGFTLPRPPTPTPNVSYIF